MKRCFEKNTQDKIGGGEEKKIKQENTEDEEEFISLSPWSEEDFEKDKLKKEISKWEREKRTMKIG